MPVAIDIYTEKFSVCVALIFKFCIALFCGIVTLLCKKKAVDYCFS